MMWLPKRPGLSYAGAAFLFVIAGIIFQDYFLNPAINGTEMTGGIAILFFLVVILRLLIGATSQRRTILDLDNATLTVLTRRLGVAKKEVFKPGDFTDVMLRQRQSMDEEEGNRTVITEPLVLSLYSFDHGREIKCAQSTSPGEMRELAEFVAEVFNVKFDNEIHHPKAINPFWPE